MDSVTGKADDLEAKKATALLANPLPLPKGKQLPEVTRAPPLLSGGIPKVLLHLSSIPERQSSAVSPASSAQRHLPSSPGSPVWSPPAGRGM